MNPSFDTADCEKRVCVMGVPSYLPIYRSILKTTVTHPSAKAQAEFDYIINTPLPHNVEFSHLLDPASTRPFETERPRPARQWHPEHQSV